MKAPALQPETRTIAAGEFKAKCLQLMDEVCNHRVTVVVTKRGKTVGHFVPPPAEEQPFRSVVGRSPSGRILGDIVSPLPQEWTLPKWAWEAPAKKAGKKRKNK